MFCTIPSLYGYYNCNWPNLASYYSLGNRFSVSYFGGEGEGYPQYNVLPSGYPSLAYNLVQGIEQPNHISQWNPMLIGVVDFNQGCGTNNSLINNGLQNAYNWGAKLFDSFYLSGLLSGSANSLTSLESQLTSFLESDELNESQKQRLQDVLDQVKDLKERVAAMQQSGQYDKESVTAIQKEVSELLASASKVVEEIYNEIKETTAENTDETDDSDKVDDSDKADDDDGTEPAKFDKKTGRPNELGEAPNILELTIMVDELYNAINGMGTTNDVIKKYLDPDEGLINASNIIEVIDGWEETHDKYEDGQGFLRRLGGDLGHYEKKKYIPTILNALEKRAHLLGIYDDIKQYASKVRTELYDCNISKTILADNLMKIYDAIKKAEADNVTKAKKAEEADENKKAEEKQKAEAEKAKKEQEKREQFLNDMREILDDDTAEISDNVKYENDKFVIRINGKDYSGKDYLNLAKAIEKAGYNPEQYLKKAAVAAAA